MNILEDVNGQCHQQTRLERWRLQRTAQMLLPEERVAFCMRRLRGVMVDVMYSPQHQSAHYNGLLVCGSVWVCPLCASRISEHRRVELEQAVACCVADGGVVYLATYTVSHSRYDTLSDLLSAFLAARRQTRQGRIAQELRQKFGVIGTVSVREVTWSKLNGWHPHCHELVFFSSEIDADAYAEACRLRWESSAEHYGLEMNEHGFHLSQTHGTVADYVAKFGREPLQSPWSITSEMTKSHLKHGRQEEHLTPFAMLELITQGDEELKPIFLEYAKWFKGKHQLVWSAGLRKRFLDTCEEKIDLEVVPEPEEDTILLGKLSYRQWGLVLRCEARGILLEIARRGSWQHVVDFVQGLDFRGLSPPSTRLINQ